MSSGIAASILIGLFVFMNLAPNSARATEEFQRVADANRKYSGWVHIRTEGVFLPATAPATRPASTQPVTYISHFNTIDGTSASIAQVNNETLNVDMYIPSRREQFTFNSCTGEITIGRTADFSNWAKMMAEYPLTVADTLALRKQQGLALPKVTESTEQGLVRFDITSDPADAKRASDDQRDALPAHAIIWTDPQTKLIRKAQYESGGERSTARYDYGDPVIREIYDVGVPRDAKVVDHRPPANVEALFARLARRSETAFGDYVALRAETDEEKTEKAKDQSGSIYLIARRGKKLLNLYYLVGPDKGNWRGYHAAPPKGWPTPALEDALASLKPTPVCDGFIDDGASAWQSTYDLQTKRVHPRALVGPDARLIESLRERSGLHIWPTQASLGLYGTDAKSDLIEDPKRPGLIGLHTVQQIWTGMSNDLGDRKNFYQSEHTAWLDPARDDLTVESIQRTNRPGSDVLQLEFHTTTLDMKQTAAGQWYPSRWRIEVTDNVEGRKQPLHYTTLHWLQIVTDKTLDDSWFIDLAKYPQAPPSTRPAQ